MQHCGPEAPNTHAMHAKPHLPEKICPVCGRPFAWRKKWERDWDQVLYCSERCRRGKTAPPRNTPTPESARLNR